MSWLRSAVNKAVEVGNKNNLTRTVRNYADTVVHHAGQAVAEGAKIFQDRLGARNYRSVKQTVKRLEEATISCRGPERVLLLRRWLVVLKESEMLSENSSEHEVKAPQQEPTSDETKDNSKKPYLVMYYDSDIGGEPMSFRDVFLQSRALEGITLSMILDAPSEEEISLLLEIFGVCLSGRKEVHNAIASGIQDLSASFSSYEDEVLVKREELLQFAQGAISGLKINADCGRIDAEASELKKKLDALSSSHKPVIEGEEKATKATAPVTIEALKEALTQVQVCSRLGGLLLKKKNLSFGDSPEIHAQKVDKLKVLSESLSNSSTKTEKRISEHRFQKEEALKVRVTKADETSEKEKELAVEISKLEKHRDELEAELKKVNISLAAAHARLRDAREERDQFEEANNQIVAHLKTKEDELSKSIVACRAEAEVLNTWINFLEDTWVVQCLYTEMIEKQVNNDLERHEEYFVNLAVDLLSAYKKHLGPYIDRIGKFVEDLKNLSGGSEKTSSGDSEDSRVLNLRKNLEEEYLAYETEIITTFSVVDNMKEHFYAQQGTMSRNDDPKFKQLFDDVEKLRKEFESIERPSLEIDIPTPKAETPRGKLQVSPFRAAQEGVSSLKHETSKHPEVPEEKTGQVLDHEAELAKQGSEFGKGAQDDSTEEIGGWEFDELERELRVGDSAK